MIGLDDFESLLNDNYIIITSIDMWHLNMIVHLPHYVIVNSFDENSFYIIDPKYGKEIKFSKDKFLKSIDDLKYRLGYSPIIFAIKKETV